MVVSCIIMMILTYLVVVTNAIHALIALILLFVNFTIILFQLEIPFLGFAYLLVYVGALSVLFLFIILLINLRIISILRQWNVFLLLISILGFILLKGFMEIKIPSTSTLVFAPYFDIHLFGSYLFVTHPLYMFLSLFILFLALFLILFLTFRETEHFYAITIFGLFVPDADLYLFFFFLGVQFWFVVYRLIINHRKNALFLKYYILEHNMELRKNPHPSKKVITKRALLRDFIIKAQTYANYAMVEKYNNMGKDLHRDVFYDLTIQEFDNMLKEAFINIDKENRMKKSLLGLFFIITLDEILTLGITLSLIIILVAAISNLDIKFHVIIDVLNKTYNTIKGKYIYILYFILISIILYPFINISDIFIKIKAGTPHWLIAYLANLQKYGYSFNDEYISDNIFINTNVDIIIIFILLLTSFWIISITAVITSFELHKQPFCFTLINLLRNSIMLFITNKVFSYWIMILGILLFSKNHSLIMCDDSPLLVGIQAPKPCSTKEYLFWPVMSQEVQNRVKANWVYTADLAGHMDYHGNQKALNNVILHNASIRYSRQQADLDIIQSYIDRLSNTNSKPSALALKKFMKTINTYNIITTIMELNHFWNTNPEKMILLSNYYLHTSTEISKTLLAQYQVMVNRYSLAEIYKSQVIQNLIQSIVSQQIEIAPSMTIIARNLLLNDIRNHYFPPNLIIEVTFPTIVEVPTILEIPTTIEIYTTIVTPELEVPTILEIPTTSLIILPETEEDEIEILTSESDIIKELHNHNPNLPIPVNYDYREFTPVYNIYDSFNNRTGKVLQDYKKCITSGEDLMINSLNYVKQHFPESFWYDEIYSIRQILLEDLTEFMSKKEPTSTQYLLAQNLSASIQVYYNKIQHNNLSDLQNIPNMLELFNLQISKDQEIILDKKSIYMANLLVKHNSNISKMPDKVIPTSIKSVHNIFPKSFWSTNTKTQEDNSALNMLVTDLYTTILYNPKSKEAIIAKNLIACIECYDDFSTRNLDIMKIVNAKDLTRLTEYFNMSISQIDETIANYLDNRNTNIPKSEMSIDNKTDTMTLPNIEKVLEYYSLSLITSNTTNQKLLAYGLNYVEKTYDHTFWSNNKAIDNVMNDLLNIMEQNKPKSSKYIHAQNLATIIKIYHITLQKKTTIDNIINDPDNLEMTINYYNIHIDKLNKMCKVNSRF